MNAGTAFTEGLSAQLPCDGVHRVWIQTFLTEQVRQYLGSGTSIEWDIVSQIAHEPSGKYRFSKSTLTDLF